MSRFWNERVAQLRPYLPGEQPANASLLKLNTNELPYDPSPKALSAMKDACTESVRLYPDPTSLALRRAIASYYQTTPERVFVGNGSDEILAHAFRGLISQKAPLLFADVSYGFYPVYCALFDQPFKEIPVNERFEIAVEDYAQACGGVVLANPNAHTGHALPLSSIERLARMHPDRTLIVDEAYVDFGAESALSLTTRFDNLLVVQTFSKSRGLAGLRIGFAIGHEVLIEGLTRVKDSFNSYPVGWVAAAGARAAILDHDWFLSTTGKVVQTRRVVTTELRALGFRVLPSRANFICLSHQNYPAQWVFDHLRSRDILVRQINNHRLKEWLRITIGTEDQMQRLVEALGKLPNPKG